VGQPGNVRDSEKSVAELVRASLSASRHGQLGVMPAFDARDDSPSAHPLQRYHEYNGARRLTGR
jgi:hypothetical protein